MNNLQNSLLDMEINDFSKDDRTKVKSNSISKDSFDEAFDFNQNQKELNNHLEVYDDEYSDYGEDSRIEDDDSDEDEIYSKYAIPTHDIPTSVNVFEHKEDKKKNTKITWIFAILFSILTYLIYQLLTL